ncbi:hypothetical protein QN277_016452 [Acacia crassicarpa]|uniref:Uncharacterized protein n=1 Tax=Acacia crassicarpa TaxID=499986 RepID=A0AAE1TC72_9FABA|nr:hypothetical protein QN277_016452 [Acacia crassicarpa]
MLVNRRTSRARPSQRSEPGSGPLGTVAAMASSSKPVSATVTAQKSRFAVIQDLELPDSALGVEDEISKDKVCFSVKPSNQGRKWETAGKVISKGAEYKNTKIQYKPKAKHAIGPMSVGLNVEKKGAATFEKHGQLDHDDGPMSDGLIVMEKGVKAKQESVPSFGLVTGPEISNGNLPLLCNSGVNEVLGKSDFLNSQNQQDNDSNATGGELISTAGQKLTPGRKSKSQRTHTVVFGSIGNVDRGKNKEEESLC